MYYSVTEHHKTMQSKPTCKGIGKKLLILIIFIGVAQKALRLWCEGPSSKKKNVKELPQFFLNLTHAQYVSILSHGTR
jgi:hypothetical protein